MERSKTSGNVILGIRPEHFEDASLVGDKPGGTFDAPIDIVEAMGSDVYAYFVVKGEEAHSADLDDLAKDTGNDLHSDGVPVTARLDAASHVQRGQTARLWFDTVEGARVRRRDRAEPGAGRPGRDDVERSPARLNSARRWLSGGSDPPGATFVVSGRLRTRGITVVSSVAWR